MEVRVRCTRPKKRASYIYVDEGGVPAARDLARKAVEPYYAAMYGMPRQTKGKQCCVQTRHSRGGWSRDRCYGGKR